MTFQHEQEIKRMERLLESLTEADNQMSEDLMYLVPEVKVDKATPLARKRPPLPLIARSVYNVNNQHYPYS